MNLRVARHTNNLEKIKSFYMDIIGFDLLGSFVNHTNYNGIMLGKTGMDWHLEFTASQDESIAIFDDDDILIFYPAARLEYDNLLTNLENNAVAFVAAKNPYWNENGKMFLDPDGYRLIVSDLKIVK